MSEEICSFILEQNGVLQTLDNVLMKGTLTHREHTCFLLANLAINSLAETLKIMNNEGLVKRLLTIVEQEKDSKIIYEALYCLKMISKQLADDKP